MFPFVSNDESEAFFVVGEVPSDACVAFWDAHVALTDDDEAFFFDTAVILDGGEALCDGAVLRNTDHISWPPPAICGSVPILFNRR